MAESKTTLILRRSDIEPLIDTREMIAAVEYAFRMHGQGRSFGRAMIHGDTPGELEFHIKAGGLIWRDRPYYGLKANGSCFTNSRLRGLPNILGAILLFDGESGFPLSIMESTILTRHRTAAGTAVGMKYLAPSGPCRLGIFGCGNQGRIHATYLREVLRIEEIVAYDADPAVAQDFARDVNDRAGIPVTVAPDPGSAARRCRVLVTCTPSKRAYLGPSDILPGSTVAAIGSDSPDKQELEPSLLKGAKVVVDILDQCAVAGELHHAIVGGIMRTDDVHAELGDVVAGRKPGRENVEEMIIYDATGTALQDTAAAVMVYEGALRAGAGMTVDLFASS